MLINLAGYYSSRIPLLDHPDMAGVTVSAAYSLRKLRTAYSGNAIRVRRSSDNAEQDIGFDGENLDTAALLSFVGAGSGFATTWYGQSTAARDLSTATAGHQSRAVNAGALETLNGQPTLRWLLSQLNFPAGFTITLPTTVYAVVDTTALGPDARVFLERTSAATDNLALFVGRTGPAGSSSYRPAVYWNNGFKALWAANIQRSAIVRWRVTATETGVRVDNATEATGSVGTQLTNWASLGNASVQQLNDVPISELLMITSTVDAAADAAIMADYNARYGIY